MNVLLTFIVRAVVVAAGLVFAASVAIMALVLLGLWIVAAGWGKLTGRPTTRFTMRMGPRSAFEQMMRRAPAAREPSRTPRADAAAGVPRRVQEEVTDVQAREPGP